jgi:hypothetical protein
MKPITRRALLAIAAGFVNNERAPDRATSPGPS